MDWLDERYSRPMDLIDRYIKQGRFDTFVHGFLTAHFERERKEAERENEWMMWTAFIHSYSDKTYGEWKKDFTGANKATKDKELTDDGIKNILNKLFKQGE